MSIRIGALREEITAFGLTATPDLTVFEDDFDGASSVGGGGGQIPEATASYEFTAGADRITISAADAGSAGNSIHVTINALNDTEPLEVGGNPNVCSVSLETLDTVVLTTAQELVDAINALSREYVAAVTTGTGTGIVDFPQDHYLEGGQDEQPVDIDATGEVADEWYTVAREYGTATEAGGRLTLDNGERSDADGLHGSVQAWHQVESAFGEWTYTRIKVLMPTLPPQYSEFLLLSEHDDIGPVLLGYAVDTDGTLWTYTSPGSVYTITPGVEFTLEVAWRVSHEAVEGLYDGLEVQVRIDGNLIETGEVTSGVGLIWAYVLQAPAIYDGGDDITGWTFSVDDFAWGRTGWIEDGPAVQTDRYGNEVLTEDAGVVLPASLQPIVATEDEVYRDTRVQRYRVFIGPDVPLDGLTRIEWRGRSLDVLGEPLAYEARGEVHHFEFDAREVVS